MNSSKLAIYILGTLLVVAAPACLSAGRSWQAMLSEGDADFSLQKLVSAERCYRAAVKQVQHTKHSDEELVRCLEKLAAALALEDETDEALALYQRSLHILEQKFGNKSPKLVPTLFALGSIYESEGDPKPAMRLYRRALAINEKSYGPVSPAVAASLHHLGRASSNAGETEAAQKHYKRSLSILLQQPGLTASHELEGLLRDYSDLLKKSDTSNSDLVSDFQNEFLKKHGAPYDHPAPSPAPEPVAPVAPPARQSAPAQPSLDINLQLAPRHPDTTTPAPATPSWREETSARSDIISQQQNNIEQDVVQRAFPEPFAGSTLAPAYEVMSNMFQNQRAYKQEEERYQRMVAIDAKALGSDSPAVADDLYGLVLLYMSQHRYSDAQPLLERALSIYQTVYGNDSLLVQTVRGTLASLVSELNQPRVGAHIYSTTLYGTALSHGQLALEPTKLETAQILNDLAFDYYRQGRLEDACTVYQWALSSTEAATGKDSPLVAACLNDYAKVLRSLGRASQADKVQLQATVILLNSRKPK